MRAAILSMLLVLFVSGCSVDEGRKDLEAIGQKSEDEQKKEAKEWLAKLRTDWDAVHEMTDEQYKKFKVGQDAIEERVGSIGLVLNDVTSKYTSQKDKDKAVSLIKPALPFIKKLMSGSAWKDRVFDDKTTAKDAVKFIENSK